jgi:hypothetical protein
MLASITPLGERGRNAIWAVTVAAFLLGSAAAAAGAGALIGAAGALVVPGSVGVDARLAALAVVLAAAIALDAGATRVPGPRRQVNEAWLGSYRGWVYGLGYGAQLGLGVTTIVTSAAVYVAVVAALLSGSLGEGGIVMGCFGLVRGLTPLLAARVQRPDQLMKLHTGLLGSQAGARRFGVAVLGVTLLLAIVWSLA